MVSTSMVVRRLVSGVRSSCAPAAADVLRRCQEELMVRIGASNVPGFTASFGVADTSQATDLATLVSLADSALFTAKREGRDRIVVSDELADGAGGGRALRPAPTG